MVSQKVSKAVTPAKAGVHKWLSFLDSRFRGNDENRYFLIFYEFVNVQKVIVLFSGKTHRQSLELIQ